MLLFAMRIAAQNDSLTFRELFVTDTIYKIKSWKEAEAARYKLTEDGICRHRLVKNTAVGLGGSLLVFGILYALPEEATSWRKKEMTFNSVTVKWNENVTSGPAWDCDNYLYNYVLHPYCGAIYYMGARGAGYKMLPSFLYTVGMSTIFWEYGIEAFAEVPSTQDLIITPIAGTMLGEGFFALKNSIKSNDDKLFGKRWAGIMTMWIIDPLNQMVDLMEGDRCKNVYSISGIGIPAGTQSYYSFSLKVNLGAGY